MSAATSPETRARRREWLAGAARVHELGRCDRCQQLTKVARQPRARRFECVDCWTARVHPQRRRRLAAAEITAAAAVWLAICWVAPAPGQAAPQTTVREARAEVHRLWGPSARRMLCIVGRESGWNPRAVSRTNDHGLTQLHQPIWARYFGARWMRVYDPVANVRMAYIVWRRQGWGAWTTARWC